MDKFANSDMFAAQNLEEMVTRAFARCSNFPKERAGVAGLADGLKTASERFGVPLVSIIRECVETSAFCPTDIDLLNVARALRPEQPKGPKVCPFGKCDGSGWLATYNLHTRHVADATGPTWVEKTPMTREQYDAWHGPKKDQEVYAGRYRCKCHPPREDEVAKRGRYS